VSLAADQSTRYSVVEQWAQLHHRADLYGGEEVWPEDADAGVGEGVFAVACRIPDDVSGQAEVAAGMV